jgi:RimJ/RimL family protein N-acetyltransferase
MKYKVLNNQLFSKNELSIVPIRYQDRLDILKWRNEQIYHLRQEKPLTVEDQEAYFNSVVNMLFNEEQPSQILFSYLQNDVCIGYGGLVHINWIDKNAEVSFIMNTELEEKYFSKHWTIFLGLIEQVAFKDLNFHKLFTYAFDLRPHIYEVIENAGFLQEAVLQEHCFFNGVYKDVIMHAKFNKIDKTIV